MVALEDAGSALGEAGHLQHAHAQSGVPLEADGDTVESVDVEVEVSDIIFLLVSGISYISEIIKCFITLRTLVLGTEFENGECLVWWN